MQIVGNCLKIRGINILFADVNSLNYLRSMKFVWLFNIGKLSGFFSSIILSYVKQLRGCGRVALTVDIRPMLDKVKLSSPELYQQAVDSLIQKSCLSKKKIYRQHNLQVLALITLLILVVFLFVFSIWIANKFGL